MSLPTYTEFASSAPAFISNTKSALFGGGSPPSPTHRNLNKAGCWDPYALSATNSTVISDDEGSDAASSVPPSPSSVRAVSMMPWRFAASPANTFHQPLWQQMELIRIPEIAPVEQNVPSTPFSLFIGQVRFETTTAELRWIIRRVANVLPVRADVRGNGCFIVFFRSAEDLDAVRRLHKRLLFDHSGVWYARTTQELEVLFEYATRTLPYVPRRSHLPRDCMTVEATKVFGQPSFSAVPPPQRLHQQQYLQQQDEAAMWGAYQSGAPSDACGSSESSVCATPIALPPAYTFWS